MEEKVMQMIYNVAKGGPSAPDVRAGLRYVFRNTEIDLGAAYNKEDKTSSILNIAWRHGNADFFRVLSEEMYDSNKCGGGGDEGEDDDDDDDSSSSGSTTSTSNEEGVWDTEGSDNENENENDSDNEDENDENETATPAKRMKIENESEV